MQESAISSPAFLSLMLASGGDRRIKVSKGGNTNQYGASPFPRATLGYAASTANDISLDAFSHLRDFTAERAEGSLLDAGAYAHELEAMRRRIRRVWDLDHGTGIVFAPSGTDLEFAALAVARSVAGRPVANLLLGADEVGSGCALAASGRYFAGETALGLPTVVGTSIEGLDDTVLVNLPVRAEDGTALDSMQVSAAIDRAAHAARPGGRHVLAHGVHGSKTGLVLPRLEQIDELRALHGNAMTLVVDACQARIEAGQISDYLARGVIVLLTGSKFIGGPPFSGIALVPAGLHPRAPLAPGLATVSRRAEWPPEWTACDHLPQGANPGLLLRLEAALFELERYHLLPALHRERVIHAFAGAVRALSARLGAPLVAPALASPALHEATLATLDLSSLPCAPDLAMAQRWCRVLAARGMRLGQPVRWMKMAGSAWSGNLRLSLSMPMICSFAALEGESLAHRLASDMAQIAGVLEAAQRPVVA